MLWLAGCNLGGSIPPSLVQLDVSTNVLTEPTPPQIAGLMTHERRPDRSLQQLLSLSLSLSGPILKSFGKLVEFMSMDVAGGGRERLGLVEEQVRHERGWGGRGQKSTRLFRLVYVLKPLSTWPKPLRKTAHRGVGGYLSGFGYIAG
jgi:hypothetical protein